MSTVLNCLDKEQTTVIGGTYFHFKPLQYKYFSNSDIAQNIVNMRRDDGFVMLPEDFDIIAMAKPEQVDKLITSEHKAILDAKRREGVENYCRRLRALLFNASVSLQKDLDIKGIKVDAKVYMNDSQLEQLEELAKYQKTKNDSEQKRLDRIKELEKQIGDIKP